MFRTMQATTESRPVGRRSQREDSEVPQSGPGIDARLCSSAPFGKPGASGGAQPVRGRRLRNRASLFSFALATVVVPLALLATGAQTQRRGTKIPVIVPNDQLPAQPDMSHPPAVGPVKSYQPPASSNDQLPNGLRIVVVEDHRFPLISARLALAAGSSRLTPKQAGLAQAEADLLTEGTASRTSLQIAQTADALGGDIGAGAGPDFLTLSASALSQNAQRMFELMADVALHPSFPESEVALHKSDMLQELAASRADAGFLAEVQFNKLLFGFNPYAITAPTDATIASLSRDALVRFHQQYFLPNNQAVMVVVGDIDAAIAHNLTQQYFGDWTLGNPAPPPSPPPPLPPTRRIYLIDRPGSAQSTVLIGNLGITRLAPDYFPFEVANEVFGGSFNSRLVADIREKQGLAYDIGSQNRAMLRLGSWSISTQVKTASTADAIQAIYGEIDRLLTTSITADELRQAKNFLGGNFVLSLETQGSVADQFLIPPLYGVPRDYLATWVDHIQAVTAPQAEAAARAVIKPHTEIVIVVGDVKQIEAPLAKLSGGSVTIYNDRGDVVGTYPPEGTSGADTGH